MPIFYVDQLLHAVALHKMPVVAFKLDFRPTQRSTNESREQLPNVLFEIRRKFVTEMIGEPYTDQHKQALLNLVEWTRVGFNILLWLKFEISL